eukprot:3479380-Rhodomonas_salina.2
MAPERCATTLRGTGRDKIPLGSAVPNSTHTPRLLTETEREWTTRTLEGPKVPHARQISLGDAVLNQRRSSAFVTAPHGAALPAGSGLHHRVPPDLAHHDHGRDGAQVGRVLGAAHDPPHRTHHPLLALPQATALPRRSATVLYVVSAVGRVLLLCACCAVYAVGLVLLPFALCCACA